MNTRKEGGKIVFKSPFMNYGMTIWMAFGPLLKNELALMLWCNIPLCLCVLHNSWTAYIWTTINKRSTRCGSNIWKKKLQWIGVLTWGSSSRSIYRALINAEFRVIFQKRSSLQLLAEVCNPHCHVACPCLIVLQIGKNVLRKIKFKYLIVSKKFELTVRLLCQERKKERKKAC